MFAFSPSPFSLFPDFLLLLLFFCPLLLFFRPMENRRKEGREGWENSASFSLFVTSSMFWAVAVVSSPLKSWRAKTSLFDFSLFLSLPGNLTRRERGEDANEISSRGIAYLEQRETRFWPFQDMYVDVRSVRTDAFALK